MEAVAYGNDLVIITLHRFSLLLYNSNTTPSVDTLMSGETPPEAIDDTSQFRVAKTIFYGTAN